MLCASSITARASTRSSFTRCIRFRWHEARCFATSSHRNGIFLGLVESRTPQSTTIEQLVAQIQPRAAGQKTQPNNSSSLLTILLTPAFAQHALDTKFPLSVMQRFTEHQAISKSLDAVVAVVDRLPAPNGAPAGAEGLAYAFLTDPDPLSVSSQMPLQMSAQKPGSISFEMPTTGKNMLPATAHLPLAQTTFTNGLPSTLIHTHYAFDAPTGSLQQSSSKRLESQALPIPFGNTAGNVAYNVPFIPLTPVRKVMSSMGNIVRKLSPHSFTQDQHLNMDPSYSPEPSSFLSASQELETAVSDYFKLLGIAPGSVQVWALILPGRARVAPKLAKDFPNTLLDIDRPVLEALWTDSSRQGYWTMRDLGVFRKGCRLARVLSGGGGWGKKAGLLSLDPDTGYSTRDLRSDQGWQFTFEDEYTDETVADQQRQALGEIIKPGESVMFFLAPKAPTASTTVDIRYYDGSDRAMTLGVIPSSIDELPEAAHPAIESQDDPSPAIQHHHDAFGMLSEGGMALTLTDEHSNDLETKIDVPFGSITLTASHTLKSSGLGKYLHGLRDHVSMKARNTTFPILSQNNADADSKP